MRESKVFSGHQPNFMPYLGYIYKIYCSDIFVLDDDVQFSNTEYQNFNYLKIQGKRSKMTIPVNYNFGDNINNVKVANGNWKRKLLKSIEMNYSKANHFEEGYEFIEKHIKADYEFLFDLNYNSIVEIVNKMGIKTEIVIASKEVPTALKKNERNVYQCTKLGCNIYLSGTGGKKYNNEKLYQDNNINIIYSDYKPVQYNQVGKEFIGNLSVLDYIMNEGFSIPEIWKNN